MYPQILQRSKLLFRLVILMTIHSLFVFSLSGQTCISVPVPDNGCAEVSMAISGAPGNNLGTNVFIDRVEVIVQHTFINQIGMYLISPSGVQIALSNANGGISDHYGNPANCPNEVTTFASWAGSSINIANAPFIGAYLPQGDFSAFNGSNPNGNWRILFCDALSGTTGNVIYSNIYFSACRRPGNLSASATSTGATLDWTENGTATSWDFEFQPLGTAQTGTPTVTGISSKPYTWTGGAAAQFYQAWVRSNCGGSTSGWSSPVTFLTAADNASTMCFAIAIPDGGCSGGGNNSINLPIQVSGVPGSSLGSDVFLDKVSLVATHSRDADVDITLSSPVGVQVDLSSDNGFTGQNYGSATNCPDQSTNFASWATTAIIDGNPPYIGNYRPEGSLSDFNGNNPNGNWTLSICDDAPAGSGTLRYVKLYFTSCARPSELTFNSATPTGITLNWTENGSATSWDLEFQPAGSAQTGVPTVTGVATKPYTWTGGMSATSYQVWVRSNCGGTSSGWTGPVTFTTLLNNAASTCTSIAIPNTACLVLPVVVSGVSGTTLGTDVFLDKVELILQHPNVNDLSISLQSPAGASVDLSSNNGTSGDNYGNPANCPTQATTFSFWASGSITGGAPPYIGNYRPEGTFSTWNGSNPNGNWTLNVCDNSPINTGNFIYARLYFTNCARPTALLASNATATGVTLEWVENGGATTWDLEFQPLGSAQTGIPTVEGTSSKPYTWTGGAQVTSYQAWVRSNCGGSVSEWIGPVTFVTGMDNTAPVCTALGIPDPGCLSVPISVSAVSGNTLGTDVFLDRVELIASHVRDADVDIYLRSPNGVEIDLSSDNGVSGDNYGNPGACPAQATTFAPWAAASISSGTAPFIGNYLPETAFTAFNGSSANGEWRLSVCDDASTNTGTFIYSKLFFTTCPRPVGLAATPTATGAAINWTESGSAASWDLEIQPVGTAQTGTPTVAGISSKPYNWTAGVPLTSYQVWVRSSCGGSSSAWVGPVAFQTTFNNDAPTCTTIGVPNNGCLFLPFTISGVSGNTLGTDVYLDKVDLILEHTRDSDVDIYLRSPNNTEIILSSGNGGNGDHYGNPAACPSQVTSFAPWATTNITAGVAPFIGNYLPETPLSSFNGSAVNGDWRISVCDNVFTFAGNFKYAKLHFTNCPRPGDLIAGTPTISGATVSWTENGGATAWDLEFQPAGTAQTGTPTVTGTNSKPYTWTGGAAGTSYQVWLRSNCGGSVSAWIGPVTFITAIDNASAACIALAVPDANCLELPIIVAGAPGNTLGSNVYLNKVDFIAEHALATQLAVYLQSPAGTEINLTGNNGGSGANYGDPSSCPNNVTSFSTGAAGSIMGSMAPFIGSYRPEQAFSGFDGQDPNGEWTLRTCDETGGTVGSLRYVKLFFSTVLPVELTTFTATPVGEKTVRLQWTTASEQNSARFEVERSANGQDFYSIASLAAAGNTTNKHDYELSDRNPLPGDNYYRLRQIDVDGRYGYSPIRLAVIAAEDLENKWNIYPNPAQSSFFVENREREGLVTLFDAAGKQVWEQALSAGNQRTEINLERLPAGVYGLKIQTENGVFVSKVVVE